MANLNLDRLRPTRLTLMALLGLLWALTFGALRDFVWADIRAGLIDLRGLTRSTRALVWLAFALLAFMVAALLFNDAWRATSPLIAEVNGVPGRGALLPAALLPVTLFVLSIAWSFLLTGALHSHPMARIGILLFYLAIASIRAFSLVTTLFGSAAFGGLDMWLTLASLLAVPLFFAIRWRRQSRPMVEFTVLLVLVSVTYTYSQSTGIDAWRSSGIPVILAEIQADIELPGIVILPLLLFFGVDVANFARRAAGWVVDIVTFRMARWALWIILIGAFIWRLRTVILDIVEQLRPNSLVAELPTYAGALVVPALVGLMWWLTTRPARREQYPEPLTPEEVGEAVERYALPLIVVYYLASMIATFFTKSTTMDLGGLIVSFAALGATVWFLRRGQRSVATYLGIFGALSIWRELSKPGAPLAFFGVPVSASTALDFWWVLGLTVLALIWLLRRALTPDRAARLLLLLLITALLRQTTFIESPFSPFLAFAGIGFVAFGIVWDVVTKGFWTNRNTHGLPRTSRLFLYLGYVLLTVTMINWALTSHDLATLGQFTGDVADAGFGRFGKPLLYAVIAATIALPASPPPDAEPEEPDVSTADEHG